jgi:mono/diheme cytochrome c family protein
MRIAILVMLARMYAATVVTQAQAPPAPVFTQQQAETGRAAYLKNCASCHQPDLSGSNEIPQLAGESFIGTWGSKTTKDLRDYMSAAMPYGGPSLDADTYTSITAYVLYSNGGAAGQQKLTESTAVPIGDVTKKRSAAKN